MKRLFFVTIVLVLQVLNLQASYQKKSDQMKPIAFFHCSSNSQMIERFDFETGKTIIIPSDGNGEIQEQLLDHTLAYGLAKLHESLKMAAHKSEVINSKHENVAIDLEPVLNCSQDSVELSDSYLDKILRYCCPRKNKNN